jgi:large subunit ribosomal protein L9
MAIIATRGAEKQVAAIQRAQKARQIRDLGHAQEVANQLGSLSVTVKAKAASDSGRLFGSVTASDVADAVRAAGGPALDRRSVDVPGQIKTLGTHAVTVRLHPEVTTELAVAVVAN